MPKANVIKPTIFRASEKYPPPFLAVGIFSKSILDNPNKGMVK